MAAANLIRFAQRRTEEQAHQQNPLNRFRGQCGKTIIATSERGNRRDESVECNQCRNVFLDAYESCLKRLFGVIGRAGS